MREGLFGAPFNGCIFYFILFFLTLPPCWRWEGGRNSVGAPGDVGRAEALPLNFCEAGWLGAQLGTRMSRMGLWRMGQRTSRAAAWMAFRRVVWEGCAAVGLGSLGSPRANTRSRL